MSQVFPISAAQNKASGIMFGTSLSDPSKGESVDVYSGAALVWLKSLLSQENPNAGVSMFLADWQYKSITAASTTAMGGGIGCLLGSIIVIPTTTSPAKVQIKDGSDGAIDVFVGGTVADLRPFIIPVNKFSRTGDWSVILATTPNCTLLVGYKA